MVGKEFKLVLKKRELTEIQLHRFRGISERAYTACLCVRCVSHQGQVTTKLLCSKLRFAPVKKITLPELELFGALLLAQLRQNQYVS